MIDVFTSFGSWAWQLVLGIQPLVEWLFTDTNILGLRVAPIYLISAGFLIAGIIRAIIGIL